MKKNIAAAVVILGIASLFLKFRLFDFEIGKYESLSEAIEKSIPYEIREIVHKEKYEGLTIIMYKAIPDKKEWPNADFDGIGIAFFEGNDQDGWENIGHNGWSHFNDENFSIDFEDLLLTDEEGNVLLDLYVTFGDVNNPDIAVMETKAEGDKEFKKAELIVKSGKRYYFQIGRAKEVRGISETGMVIDQQGG
jgi:hypothetical protein